MQKISTFIDKCRWVVMKTKTNADKKPRMPILRERLNELRGELSYAEFAEKLDISRATVGFYLAGERVPDALTLKKIAEKCKVSVDYLLGLSDAANLDNMVIGSELGLSDKAIDGLRKSTDNPFRKVIINELLEDDKMLSYISQYLFSFLEEERKSSRFRYVPVRNELTEGYADMNLVRLIELLPLWRRDMIDKIKSKDDLANELLLRYIASRTNKEFCKYELSRLQDTEETIDIDEPEYDPDDEEDYEDIELGSYHITIGMPVEDRESALQEMLNFLEGLSHS